MIAVRRRRRKAIYGGSGIPAAAVRYSMFEAEAYSGDGCRLLSGGLSTVTISGGRCRRSRHP
jgi:hypothetical protein